MYLFLSTQTCGKIQNKIKYTLTCLHLWARPRWFSKILAKSQHLKMASRLKEGSVEYVQIDGLVSIFTNNNKGSIVLYTSEIKMTTDK